MKLLLGVCVIGLLAASPCGAYAQDPAHVLQEAHSQRDINILEHLGNSHHLELPYWKPPYTYSVELPHFPPVKIAGVLIDFSITKHLVFMWLAALVVLVVILYTSRKVARAQAAGLPPRGFAAALEAIVLYVRGDVILPNVGPHGEGYVDYLLTVFFFILGCNLCGLLPWGATPTGNIAVTAAMAILSLIVIEVSGMRSLGFKGYMQTIFYLPPGLPGWIKPIMLVIMTPIEIIGKLAKPFALAVRLFANMTAGHVVLLALIGLTFFFQSYVVGFLVASPLSTAVMVLELFVAFLHAFIFTLLTSVFIGLMRAEH